MTIISCSATTKSIRLPTYGTKERHSAALAIMNSMGETEITWDIKEIICLIVVPREILRCLSLVMHSEMAVQPELEGNRE